MLYRLFSLGFSFGVYYAASLPLSLALVLRTVEMLPANPNPPDHRPGASLQRTQTSTGFRSLDRTFKRTPTRSSTITGNEPAPSIIQIVFEEVARQFVDVMLLSMGTIAASTAAVALLSTTVVSPVISIGLLSVSPRRDDGSITINGRFPVAMLAAGLVLGPGIAWVRSMMANQGEPTKKQ